MTRLVTPSRRVRSVALVLALGFGLVLCRPRPALALGEEEWLASLSLGGGLFGGDGEMAAGASGGLEIARGLTDVFAARAGFAMEWFAWPATGRSPAEPSQGVAFTAGGVAAFDVLRVVPFVELGLVLAHFGRGSTMGARAGAELGLGADYLLDRNWSLGGVIRGRLLPVGLEAQADGIVPSGAVVIRLGRRFF